MSVCRKLPDGTIQKIAGHTILLDANASEIREGNFTLPATSTGQTHSATITFTDPMPDNDYIVVITGNGIATEEDVRTQWHVTNKTVTGFTASYYSQLGATISYHYYAWKPIKLDGYTALQNKVNNPDDTPTIDSMNLVTSDGVARAIENASAVWKGTRAEWNALPATTKIKYDLAVITDGGLIKSVDRTTGDSDDVADLTKVWTGTQAEWDAMTQVQKNKWDKAMIQDGYYGITPAVLPVGCVQAYMGSVEPPGWLLCNGQTFDASVYPDLYNVLGINKVPDLRGEFLRGAGTGTNGYTGPAVKAHQEATGHQYIVGDGSSGSNNAMYFYVNNSGTGAFAPTNIDKTLSVAVQSHFYNYGSRTGISGPAIYASRPANTGVNWIIFAGPAQ